MSELERLQQELAEEVRKGEELARREESTSTDLVVSGGAEAMREELARIRKQAERQAVLIQAKAAEVAARAEVEQERMKAIERRAREAVEPVQQLLEQLSEGLKTIGLYLGTGEQIVELRDGEPASFETPVTVRQMVLRMDEEVAAAAEDGGLDWRNFAQFDTWLLEDPAHLDQVLPEPKGVVCFTPRDPARSKQDTRQMLGKNPDAQTYWLIRNGQRLYRTTAEFIVGDKLVPGPEDFDRLFFTTATNFQTGERERVPVKPGTREWEQAHEQVESTERHYYRVALILEGLLHRTPVFHPAPHDLSFLDPAAHDAGRVRFILDYEASLGDGHEPFRDWQRRLNGQLRPGMRIVGSFDYSTGFASYSREARYGHQRLHPGSASWPESGVIYELKQVQGKRLGFTYPRTDRVFRPYDWRRGYDDSPAKTSASCAIKADDEWIIPFDLTTEEELRRFLHYRTDRKNYVEMFPLITSAIQAKRHERELEAPFRTMLAGVLARENGVTVAAAAAAVPELVDWFKTTNKWHRPLVHDVAEVAPLEEAFSRRRRAREEAEHEARVEQRERELAKQAEQGAKAVRLITAEHARRVRIERRKPDGRIVAKLAELYPSSVMIGRRRSDGKYIAVVPERSDEEVFARLVTWGPRKGLESEERWQMISKAQAARWQVLSAHERWTRWDHEARSDQHVTDPEIEQLTEQVKRRLAGDVAESASEPRRKRKDGLDPRVSQSADQLLALTLERSEGQLELYAWFLEGETRLPDSDRPLTGDQGERANLEAVYYTWARWDGGVRLRPARRSYTTGRYSVGWKGLEARLAGKRRLEHGHRLMRLLWEDDDRIRRERDLMQEYDRRMDRRNELSQRRWAFIRAIQQEWTDAWWENKRREWVAEYGKPELWQGQRKIIETKMRRNYERLDAPTNGLHGLLAPFVERGEEERVWGRLVADVLNEAIGRGWQVMEPESEDEEADDAAKLDPSILSLRFTKPEPEEPGDADEDWTDDVQLGDAEGTIEPAGELEAGPMPEDEIADAEVIEDA